MGRFVQIISKTSWRASSVIARIEVKKSYAIAAGFLDMYLM